jgi:heme A synthase
MWLNFGFNQYMIQLVHRVVAAGLGASLLILIACAGPREPQLRRGAGLLFALVAAEIAAGASVLYLGGQHAAAFAPAAIAHEVGGIVLLAAALAAVWARIDRAGASP